MTEFRDKMKRKYDPIEQVEVKLSQLVDIREEMWLAWERSKENAETNVIEEELRKVYEDFTDGNGKTTRQVTGESMQLVKKIQRIAGRLPEDRYIAKIIDCLKEESRLLGLTDDAAIKVVNNVNNVGGDQIVGIDWGRMQGQLDATTDEVEAKIARVTQLPEEVGPPWTAAEAKEIDDDPDPEPEHLNGDGK
jgi:hypothetical protein